MATNNTGKSITCSSIPEAFFAKEIAKLYFSKFGQINRFYLYPQRSVCIVEYENRADANKAVLEAGNYLGTIFKVAYTSSSSGQEPPKQQALQQLSTMEPEYIDDEVLSELDAMRSNYKTLKPDTTQQPLFRIKTHEKLITQLLGSKRGQPSMASSSSLPTTSSFSQLTKTSTSKASTTDNPKISSLLDINTTASPIIAPIDPAVKHELRSIMKKQCLTPEEKLRVLEARDKLVRLQSTKTTDIKMASSTKGVCPDMCPEKERIMRVVKHQIGLYEMDTNARTMNHSIAIKQYSRSSADQESPLPHDLRSATVLKMTMNYLLHNIIDLCDMEDTNIGEWYHFVWDRTRGIRKDITQQELCCSDAVQLVEQCARFHIHCAARLIAEEPQIFDQRINTENLTKCLQSLKYLYHDLRLKGVECANESEFRAYVILLNLQDSNFLWEIKQLPERLQRSPEIRFAIQIYMAMENNNYVKFFQLIRKTTYMNACILLRYFAQVRLRALTVILKAYAPRNATVMLISHLTYILAFEDDEQCYQFLITYGMECDYDNDRVSLDRQTFCHPDIQMINDRSINIVEHKRECSVGECVYGGPLESLSTFLQHKIHESFDDAGYLISDAWDASDQDHSTPKPKNPAMFPIPYMKQIEDYEDESIFKVPMHTAPKITHHIPKKVISMDSLDSSQINDSIVNTPSIISTNVFSEIHYEKPTLHPPPKPPATPSLSPLQSQASTPLKEAIQENQFSIPIFSFQTSKSIIKPGKIESSPFKISPTSNQPSTFSEFPTTKSASIITNIIPQKTPSIASNIFGGSQFQQSKPMATKELFSTTNSDKFTINTNLFSEFGKNNNNTNDRQITTATTPLPSIFSVSAKPSATKNAPSQNTFSNSIFSSGFSTIPVTAAGVHHQQQDTFNFMEKQMEAEIEEKRKQLEMALKEKQMEENNKLIETQSNKIQNEIVNEFIEDELRNIITNEISMKKNKLNKEYLKLTNEIINEFIQEFLYENFTIEYDAYREYRLSRKYAIQWLRKIHERKYNCELIEKTPIWLPEIERHEQINELQLPLQNVTIEMKKRYLSGLPNRIVISKDTSDNNYSNSIDLFKMICNTEEFQKKLLQSQISVSARNIIYWKCAISLPDYNEDQQYSTHLAQWIDKVFVRKSPNHQSSTIFFLEESNVNNIKIRICLRKLCGNTTVDNINGHPASSSSSLITDSLNGVNGLLIFIGINHSIDLNVIGKRLINLFTNCKIQNKPYRIVLYDIDNSIHVNNRIEHLVRNINIKLLTNIDYKIFLDQCFILNEYGNLKRNGYKLSKLTNNSLESLIQECCMNNPPGEYLEMQQNDQFLRQCLIDEFWKRIEISMKYNPLLFKAMKNINFIIELYNNAIDRLIKLCKPTVTDDERINFPTEFQRFFSANQRYLNETQITIPLSYEYFPIDWFKYLNAHQKQLEQFLDSLKLPKFNIEHCLTMDILRDEIFTYCKNVIKNNSRLQQNTAYTIIYFLLKYEDECKQTTNDRTSFNVLFHEEFLWFESIKTIALAILSNNFTTKNLPEKIIYHKGELYNFLKKPWWINEGLLDNIKVDINESTISNGNSTESLASNDNTAGISTSVIDNKTSKSKLRTATDEPSNSNYEIKRMKVMSQLEIDDILQKGENSLKKANQLLDNQVSAKSILDSTNDLTSSILNNLKRTLNKGKRLLESQ